jgi:hypothetical protein
MASGVSEEIQSRLTGFLLSAVDVTEDQFAFPSSVAHTIRDTRADVKIFRTTSN